MTAGRPGAIVTRPRERLIYQLEKRERVTNIDDRFATTHGVVALTTRPDGRKPCGHSGHVGACPLCQQAQLARWQAQLAEVDRDRPPA